MGSLVAAIGLVLATSDSDGSARLWDMTANAPVHLADLDDHSGYAETIAFSPDGKKLIYQATAARGGCL